MDAEDWRAGYQAALKEYMLEHGTPVSESRDLYYGSIAEDWQDVREHQKQCQVTVSDIQEDSEYQFEDTFNGSKLVYYIEAVGSCACGRLRNRRWRVEQEMSKIILDLLKEEAT